MYTVGMPRPTKEQMQETEALHQGGFRRCRTCQEVLPLELFGACKQTKHGLQVHCKPCINKRNTEKYRPNMSEEARLRKLARMKEGRKANPDRWRKYSNDNNARRYGFNNYEEYRGFLDRPCEICQQAKAVHVDHCYTEGHTRGALCANCNLMLGHSKDNPATLLAAVAYLTRHE